MRDGTKVLTSFFGQVARLAVTVHAPGYAVGAPAAYACRDVRVAGPYPTHQTAVRGDHRDTNCPGCLVALARGGE